MKSKIYQPIVLWIAIFFLIDEMKMVCLKNKKYKGFPDPNYPHGSKTGLPFLFKNPYHIKNKAVNKQNDSVDDPNEAMPRFA